MKDIIKDRIEKIENNIVPQGYKKTEIGIIPEDWEVFNFKDIFKVSQGLQIPIKERLNKKEKNCYIYITNEYINNKNNIRHAKEYVKNPKKNVIANKKDILMTRTGNTGIVVTNEEGVFHNNFFKINYNESDFSKDFLIYTLRGDYIQYNIRNLAGTSTIPDLTHSDFYSLNGMFPPLKEQEKIASILSTWDQYIENIDSIIESKKKQKKGLMQNLLTGEVRLPGFNGEWKEVKLGDIGKAYNGLSGKNKEHFKNEDLNSHYITYKNIFNNNKIDLTLLEKVKVNSNERQNKVKKGDIFFTISSETPEEVGMSSVLLSEIKKDIYLNSFSFGFRLNNYDDLLPIYSMYLFRNFDFRCNIYKLAQGSTRFNLSKIELLKVKITLPPIDEQVAIASVLSSADREIELLEDLRNKRMEEKKGLMQLLLTGIVRVGG